MGTYTDGELTEATDTVKKQSLHTDHGIQMPKSRECNKHL